VSALVCITRAFLKPNFPKLLSDGEDISQNFNTFSEEINIV
jgi:hypothetical protein